MITKILVFLLCFGEIKAYSDDKKIVGEPKLNNYASIQWANADDPMGLRVWAKEQLAMASVEKDEVEWTLAFLLNAEKNSYKDIEKFKLNLNLAEEVSLRHNLKRSLYQIEDWRVLLEFQSNFGDKLSNENEKKLYEERIRVAKKHQFKDAIANLLSSRSILLLDLGETNQSLQDALDAIETANKSTRMTLVQKLEIKAGASGVFSYLGKNERVKEVHRVLTDFCRKNQVRELCATTLHNFGSELYSEGSYANLLKAESMFLEKLRIVESLGNTFRIGTSHYGLVKVYGKLKDVKKIKLHSAKAEKIFISEKDDRWLSYLYFYTGDGFYRSGLNQEALQINNKAIDTLPKGYRYDLNDMLELKYKILFSQSKFKEAFLVLQKYFRGYKELVEERDSKNYSAMMVKMGLQVEEEKNKYLEKEVELKNQKIQEAERFKIILKVITGLSILMVFSMGIAIYRSIEVKRNREKMKNILDNVDQGILVANQYLKIEPGYSQFLKKILNKEGQSLVGHDVCDRLFEQADISNDEKEIIRESLKAAIGEDDLQWMANEDNLIKEYNTRQQKDYRTLALDYVPIFNSNRRISSVLISVKDVTEGKKMEKQITKNKEEMDFLTKAIQQLATHDVVRVRRFLSDATTVLQNVSNIDEKNLKTVLRDLHTIKGLARIFDIKELSNGVHHIETSIKSSTSADLDLLNTNTMELIQFIEKYQTVIANYFSAESAGKDSCTSLMGLVQRQLPDLTSRIEDANLSFEGIELKDSVITWPREWIDILEQVLVHILNNSLDHGYILPSLNNIQVGSPKFTLQAARTGEGLHLNVCDEGNGLNKEALISKAKKLGVNISSDSDLWELVFRDGFSTAESTTTTSGRGVGMAAARQVCRQHGGDLSIQPNPAGKGTVVSIVLPVGSRNELDEPNRAKVG